MKEVGWAGDRLAQRWIWALWVWEMREGVMVTSQDHAVGWYLLHRRWMLWDQGWKRRCSPLSRSTFFPRFYQKADL